ncbi:alpha-amylase family glycosyl hydrolase [Marinitoga litoralis]|uniref:alpha-amylase family glycosyl hydrolase n=1 Tax=Marinitoga litoralis TaxID=570855 RepID=UPI001961B11C|nr:alpha-amylase family glycosyl hydrolase [Marinitoga litoralis]MBM7559553.1 glycosidase [Marinitoga litoralis]
MKKLLIILFILLSIYSFSRNITIYYTHDASSVILIGDFGEFEMEKSNTGIWKKELDLNEGEYKYLFLVDGREEIDYKNLNTVYSNGKIYSLLIIKDETFIPEKGDGNVDVIFDIERRYINPVKPGEIYLSIELNKNDAEDVFFVGNGEVLKKEIIEYEKTILYRFHVITPVNILNYKFVIKDGINIEFPENYYLNFNFDNPIVNYLNVPEWSKGVIYYQIFPERFRNGNKENDPKYTNNWYGPYDTASLGSNGFFGGDLEGVIQSIDYLNELGIEAIYFNPIFESVSSHKYDTKDYMKIDPHFGDEKVFEEIVNKLKENNIKVILDGVFNHSGDEFFAMQDIFKNQQKSKYLDWYYIKKFPVRKSSDSYESWWGYADLPKLNLDNFQVRSYIIQVLGKWMSYGIDGWRLDAVDQVKDSFWELFYYPIVKEINPNTIISGEYWKDSTHYFNYPAFDVVMNYLFRDAVLGYAKGGSASNFVKNTDYLKEYPPQIIHRLWNMLDSHDTARVITELNGDINKLKIAVGIQMTFVGAPVIYYGDEIGLDGGKDPWCRKPFPWDEEFWNMDVFEYYKSLIKLRKEHEAVRYGEYEVIKKKLGALVYRRFTENDEIIVITNSRKTPVKLNIDLKNNYYDYFTGEKITNITEIDGVSIKILIRQ